LQRLPFQKPRRLPALSAYAHLAFCECVKEEVEERVLRLLHDDADMRKAFLDKIATPIANKMFECGLFS